MFRYDFVGRILKVHHDKFTQTYSPSPLSAFPALSLSSSMPNSAHPYVQSSTPFGMQQQLGQGQTQFYGRQSQNQNPTPGSMNVHSRFPSAEGMGHAGVGEGLQFNEQQLPPSARMMANPLPLLSRGDESTPSATSLLNVISNEFLTAGRAHERDTLSSISLKPGNIAMGQSASTGNLSTIANATTSPKELATSPAMTSMQATASAPPSMSAGSAANASSSKRLHPIATTSTASNAPSAVAPSCSTSPRASTRTQARASTSPRATSLSSHPAHPGHIQIPPPPHAGAFPMIPPHGFSPGATISPMGHSYSPHHHPHYPPLHQLTPLQHPSASNSSSAAPMMTPHGLSLPPITPSMPSFSFVPGMQPSPGGMFTPGVPMSVMTPGVGYDPGHGHSHGHRHSISQMSMMGYGGMMGLGMGGMGMMMGSSAALITPPIHPSHVHPHPGTPGAHAAHHAMMSVLSPGVAMSPGAFWGRGMAGPVGSGGPSEGGHVHNQTHGQQENEQHAGGRRGSGVGLYGEPVGYFEGVPIPMERPSSAHVEEDGGYFVGAPLRLSSDARASLEREVLKDASGLGRRGSASVVEAVDDVNRPKPRQRSSSGSARSVSETFDHEHERDAEGFGSGERRNSSSVATSWRSSSGGSDAMEKMKRDAVAASSVDTISALPKRRAKSKEPRRPPLGLFGVASGGARTDSSASGNHGKSKSAGASTGTSVDGDLLSCDERLAFNLSQLAIPPQPLEGTSRAYSLSASEEYARPRAGLFYKSHSDETGEKLQARTTSVAVDTGALESGYSFARTPGNRVVNGRKTQSQSETTTHTPVSGASKGVGLGLGV